MTTINDAQAADPELLSGTPAISRFFGWPQRRTYYMLQGGYLPAFQIGSRWCMRPAAARAWLMGLEKKAATRTRRR